MSMNLSIQKKLISLLEKGCTDSNLEDFCDENGVLSKEVFHYAAEYLAPSCCKGCKNVDFYPSMPPCTNCNRRKQDLYEGQKNETGRNFLNLTKDEIEQVVTDIFSPEKITCIRKSKKWDEITCKIYLRWEGDTSVGEPESFLTCDEITLKNPFNYGERAIYADFSLSSSDYRILKQFCYAKGIRGKQIEWMKDNPYN